MSPTAIGVRRTQTASDFLNHELTRMHTKQDYGIRIDLVSIRGWLHDGKQKPSLPPLPRKQLHPQLVRASGGESRGEGQINRAALPQMSRGRMSSSVTF